ncbi:hypothetical protein [Accumulibacter sp.]|uniref:hypothetical protein n=1 Tax=Accumulibacter sp. TaxID=2053492 RepID=UPI0028C385BB|nr:hypothetical protein [Accumulibacter sp.]
MKTLSGTKEDFVSYSFAAMIFGSAAFISFANASSEAVLQTSSSISHVSGGVGDESIGRLNSLSSDCNIKLLFAMTSGEFWV